MVSRCHASRNPLRVAEKVVTVSVRRAQRYLSGGCTGKQPELSPAMPLSADARVVNMGFGRGFAGWGEQRTASTDDDDRGSLGGS